MGSVGVAAEITEVRDRLCVLAATLDSDSLYPHDAMKLVGTLRSIVNVASALEASVAEWVAQGRA